MLKPTRIAIATRGLEYSFLRDTHCLHNEMSDVFILKSTIHMLKTHSYKGTFDKKVPSLTPGHFLTLFSLDVYKIVGHLFVHFY